MRVHRFVRPNGPPIGLALGAPNWIGYTCLDCGRVSGLDAWQIQDMPTSMAKCSQGRRLGVFEWLALKLVFAGIDCLRRR